MGAMTQVLIVCSGNTCRSPMAAAVLAALLADEGPAGVSVASAGTSANSGAPASEGAYLVSLEMGIDLSAHRSQLLTAEMVQQADLILTMSAAHLRRVTELGGAGKAHLLASYASGGASAEEVADPFGGDLSTYRQTFRHLLDLMGEVLDRLASEAGDDQR